MASNECNLDIKTHSTLYEGIFNLVNEYIQILYTLNF